MAVSNKDKIRALLKRIETRDPGPVAVVNEAKYIQHNPQTHEGSEGIAALFQRLSRTGPKVNVVRASEDGDLDRITEFVDEDTYAEHNPRLMDGVPALRSALEVEDQGGRHIDYHRVHRVLAEGNFVFCVSEGRHGGVHSALYDLFRLADDKVVEHWDTTEKIAPRSEWKNDNGKF